MIQKQTINVKYLWLKHKIKYFCALGIFAALLSQNICQTGQYDVIYI